MDLRKLLEGFIGENIDIKGIKTDSRQVSSGDLFIALPSVTGKDIRPFIKQAISKGANAVICTSDLRKEFDSVPINFISSDNPRKDLAYIASKYYTDKPQNIVAVTGTNGKSSVVEFTRQIWEATNNKAASIGTIGIYGEHGNRIHEESLTSPDTLFLHESLKSLASEGYTHVALEASSHGLDQYRIANLPLKAAAFTNLTQDHLDYHGDLETYFQAKSKLFKEFLPKGATAVLNADIEQYPTLRSICEHNGISVLDYGMRAKAFKIVSCSPEANGLKASLELLGDPINVHFPLIGEFQLMNALCALGLALSSGTPKSNLSQVLENLRMVPGRLEYVGSTSDGGHVYVDYAHTPDALENVLKAVRPHTKASLKILFGCGGNRDVFKRPIMGKIACQFADSVIISDDNPRHEDPIKIRQEIMQTCPKAQEVNGRENAIRIALKSLDAGDILVVAGKGHETGQIIGDNVIPFSDKSVIQKYLQEGQV